MQGAAQDGVGAVKNQGTNLLNLLLWEALHMAQGLGYCLVWLIAHDRHIQK